ncbi:MAG: GNAT family N-acetyltransferase [Holophagales bacterium]|nr:GNAT family N-acetyltransferase [Holophagales bacterium]
MALLIRALVPEDDRSAFRSGNIDLDRFFRRFAGQNQFRHYVGVTYVAVDGDSILGFVTVAAASIELASVSPAARKRLPAYPLPVLRLARLAVDEEAKGQGIGSALLRHSFLLAREMAGRLGCVGVVVDAKEDALPFYERYGFEALDVEAGQLGDRPEPTPMFLEIGAIPGPGRPKL